MDRTAIATCALALLPALLCAGCGAKSEPPADASAPRVLVELQQAAPGPWRRPAEPISTASLERPVEDSYSPAVLDAAEIQDLQARMHPGPPAAAESAEQSRVAQERAAPRKRICASSTLTATDRATRNRPSRPKGVCVPRRSNRPTHKRRKNVATTRRLANRDRCRLSMLRVGLGPNGCRRCRRRSSEPQFPGPLPRRATRR